MMTGPRFTTAKVTKTDPVGRITNNDRNFATLDFFKAQGSPGEVIAPSTAGVQFLAKLLTGLEVRGEFLRNLHSFTGPRVSAHARAARLD